MLGGVGADGVADGVEDADVPLPKALSGALTATGVINVLDAREVKAEEGLELDLGSVVL